MYWNLLLAHFIGDYVLQNNWMVRNRHKFWVLPLHAAIHLILMTILLIGSLNKVFPYLLLLALVHYTQDKIKEYFTKMRPDLTAPFYVIDQVLHYLIIGLAVWWMQQASGMPITPEKPVWAVIAIAYLFVTNVWFITEMILNIQEKEYLKSINQNKYSRMVVRAGFVFFFLIARTWALSGATMVGYNPYPEDKFRRRAIITDLLVSITAILFLIWAL